MISEGWADGLQYSAPVIIIAVGALLYSLELACRFFAKKRFSLGNFLNSLSIYVINQIFILYILVMEIYTSGDFLLEFQQQYSLVEPLDISNPITWILGLLIFDFADYAFHRLSHETRILWVLHETHHSLTELYGYNGLFRFHPLDINVIVLFSFFLCVLLGVPPLVVIILQVPIGLLAIPHHSDWWLSKPWGVLERIIITPNFHNIHHGRQPKYMDVNYASTFFNVFDLLFGRLSNWVRTIRQSLV